MIPELGLLSLVIAFVLSLLASILLPVSTAFSRYRTYSQLGTPLALLQGFFICLSFFTLMLCFWNNDYSVSYVAHHANTHLPWYYKLCAVWGGHEGSLLLWSTLLSGWTMAAAFYLRRIKSDFSALVLGILSIIQAGFLILLLHTSNPFTRLLPFVPEEGADLNPLLQDIGFVLHPPFLYLGYVGLAVPFAFACAGLLHPHFRMSWPALARPFAAIAFAFLTVGIVLGSWWAYYELGWGGWWFWDPVENASFMPWLVGVALVHALSVSTRFPEFKRWAALLAISAFMLSLIGTFLVRSGVLSSVHAFASDPTRGNAILIYIVLLGLGAFGLYGYSAKEYASQKRELLSKESLILLGNSVFYVAMLTVLLGTLYPLAFELLNQGSLSVGPPYFNRVFLPLMVPVLILMATVPHLHWRQGSLAGVFQRLKWVLLCLIGIVLISQLGLSALPLYAQAGVVLGAWVIVATVIQVFRQGMSLKRFAMVVSHVGFALSIIGISLTPSLETEKEYAIHVGETAHIAEYAFHFNSVRPIEGPNFRGMQGEFVVTKDNKTLTTLYPEKRFFVPRNQPMTETAISAGFLRDFYVALGERFEDGSWSVRLYIKPFIRWIWLGGLIIALGALISGCLALRERRSHYG